MTPDRGIRPGLGDTRLSAGQGDQSDDRAAQERGAGEVDPRDLQRMQRSLAAAPAPAVASPGSYALSAGGPAGLPSSALGSFMSPQAVDRAHPDPRLRGELLQAVSRLLVGERSGRRQVRVELDDEVLPGVSIEIEEAQGRLQVVFTCALEPSRTRLNEALPAMAPQLAKRLARPVLMRTQTDDPQDPHPLEVAASP